MTAAESRLVECGYLGDVRWTTDRSGADWQLADCSHPQLAWATPERCQDCPFYQAKGETLKIQPVSIPDRTLIARVTVPDWKPPADDKGKGKGKDGKLTTRMQRSRAREVRAMARAKRQATAALTVGPVQPQGLCVDRDHNPAPLGNLWYGAHLFVVLSGPSLNDLPLERLNHRGVITFAVNNAATVFRPTLWTHVDPVEKFHEWIWDDPGIIKFTPVRCFGGLMRRWSDKTGKPELVEEPTKLSPGTFGYRREAFFNPDTFLTEPAVNWGNAKRQAAKNGHPHIVNVMFAMLRLSFYLGFRQVYLLGCDFRMEEEQPYAFEESKHLGGCQGNNGSYLKLNTMLGMLKPHFDKAGFKVYNCNAKSGLRVFPYMSFEEALDAATKKFKGDCRTAGWYTKDRGGSE